MPITTQIYYNNINLNTLMTVLRVDEGFASEINLFSQPISGDGGVLSGKKFGSRKIVVEGYIAGANRQSVEQSFDTLKGTILSVKEKSLDLWIAGAFRRFKTTAIEPKITKNLYNTVFFSITFLCSEGYGKDTTTTALGLTTPITVSPTNNSKTILGSAYTPPTITLTLNSLRPWWIPRTMLFTLTDIDGTIREFSLSRKFNIGDIIKIDGENKIVSINDTLRKTIDTCDAVTFGAGQQWLTVNAVTPPTLIQTNHLEGTGALQLNMSVANQSPSFDKINFPPITLSSTSGFVRFLLFIPTPTAGTLDRVRLYIGSDANLTNNFCYWDITTQDDGSALVTNGWNYINVDLSTAPTATTGAPDRSNIKSLRVMIRGTSAAWQISDCRLDYIINTKTGTLLPYYLYSGVFPVLSPGLNAINYTDTFTSRNITCIGEYTKRFL